MEEKINFIRLVINNPTLVFGKTKVQIKTELEKQKYTRIEQLLSMPIYSWSGEKIKELEKNINSLHVEIQVLEKKTKQKLWNEDLENLIL